MNDRSHVKPVVSGIHCRNVPDLKLSASYAVFLSNSIQFAYSFQIFRFKIESHLKTHRLTHDGAPIFKCQFENCDRTFVSKHSLRKHMEIHAGVITKPRVCDICEKQFRTNNELRVCFDWIAGIFKQICLNKLMFDYRFYIRYTGSSKHSYGRKTIQV